MVSEDSYVSLVKAKEVASVLKQYLKVAGQQKEAANDENQAKNKKGNKLDTKPKKPLPLGGDGGNSISEVLPTDKVLLQVDFKKIPLNKTVYVNNLGPLPYPWIAESDAVDICLIVRDLDTKKSGPDRELDLHTTREHYRNLLTGEGSGLTREFIDKRIYILTMRELLTEYKEPEAKNKLAAAYDVFLADKMLMNNKFKELNSFIGAKFWTYQKKVPTPVDLKKTGDALGVEIMTALEKTPLYVTGRGSSETVQIGIHSQTASQIGYNLEFVLKQLRRLFDLNVGSLRIKTTRSISIPFYADLGSKNNIDPGATGPQTKALGNLAKFDTEDFTLLNRAKVGVNALGDLRVVAKSDNEITFEDKDEDDVMDRIEQELIETTAKGRTFPKHFIDKDHMKKRAHKMNKHAGPIHKRSKQ
jgi:hypothetical protein